jgi:MFS family permease
MRDKTRLIVFASAVFLMWFSQYSYVPTLPEYLRARLTSLALVGSVLAMYGLWQVVVRLPLGILIDAVGRQKLFILGGFCLCALGALLLGSARTAFGLYVGRSLTGAAMGTWVPLVVVFSGFFPEKQSVRASAILAMVSAAAKLSASALNGYLNQWGGSFLAFLVAAWAAAAGALLVLPVPVDSRPAGAPRLRPLLGLFLRGSVLLPSVLAALNQYVIFGISLGFMPVLAGRLGAGDISLGYLATTNLLFFVVGNMAVTSSTFRFRSESMMLVSYLLFGAAVGLAGLARSIPFLFILQAFIGIAHGIGYPVQMGLSIRDVPSGQRTAAMGFYQSVYANGIFLGPWACGVLAESLGLRPMFALTAGAVLVLGLSGGIVLLRQAGRQEVPPGKGTSP